MKKRGIQEFFWKVRELLTSAKSANFLLMHRLWRASIKTMISVATATWGQVSVLYFLLDRIIMFIIHKNFSPEWLCLEIVSCKTGHWALRLGLHERSCSWLFKNLLIILLHGVLGIIFNINFNFREQMIGRVVIIYLKNLVPCEQAHPSIWSKIAENMVGATYMVANHSTPLKELKSALLPGNPCLRPCAIARQPLYTSLRHCQATPVYVPAP